MLAAAVGSYFTTRKQVHEANHFNFHPIREVAILFIGIFATMMPALDWLGGNARQLLGDDPASGLFYWGSGMLSSVLDNAPTYLSFLSAVFGSFVDQDIVATGATSGSKRRSGSGGGHGAARRTRSGTRFWPLQKYHGGSRRWRQGVPEEIEVCFLLGNATFNKYILAISIGAVFFGANTYIGNGPNFMVKSIADHQKVRTPTFLGYRVQVHPAVHGADAAAGLVALLPGLGGLAEPLCFPARIALRTGTGNHNDVMSNESGKLGVRTLYNILFTIFFVLSSPYYFLRMRRRGNWQHGFGQRFGDLRHQAQAGHHQPPRALDARRQRRRGERLHPAHPRAGAAHAEPQDRRFHHHDHRAWANCRKSCPRTSARSTTRLTAANVSRARSARSSPEAIVLVEAEIWPNFLWRARDLGIPLFLVNARLSDRSYRGYKRFGFLFRPLFASFAGVGAQNEADAARLRELGCRPEAIHVVGSLKFDAAKLDERRLLDVPGPAAPAGRAAGRARCWSAAARMPARKPCWPNSSCGCARAFPGSVPRAGAAAFRAQPGGRARVARARA